jgi:transposase InsO family protein
MQLPLQILLVETSPLAHPIGSGGQRYHLRPYSQEGFLYLAFILEVYSRRVEGWAMTTHLLHTELVVDALEMAL